MARRPIQLYLSHTTWVAAAGAGDAEAISGTFSTAGSEAWTSLGHALRQRFPSQRRARAVLSARLCRFLVAPWIAGCFTGKAIRAYVVEMFAELQGVSDTTHHIEIQWPPYGQPVLAVAYPRAWVEAVREGLEASGFVLEAVAASIDPVLRAARQVLQAPDALLAYAEDDGIAGITLESGQVTQIESLAAHGAGLDDATLWLTRKRFAFADESALHWLATGTPPGAFPGTTLPIEGADRPASPGHAMVALCRH